MNFCLAKGSDSDADADSANACDAVCVRRSAADKQRLSLMQEYLHCSLAAGMYVSFPSLDSADYHDAISFVQVLAKNQKCIGPTQCKPLRDDSDSLLTTVSVQPFERMLPFLGGVGAAQLQQADIFMFEDERPLPIQLPFSPDDRPNILRWENHGQSELYDSCISLRNPKPLQPDVNLLSKSCPVLCLLDALAERGWHGRSQRFVHGSNSELLYDQRQPMGKKVYYQCLIVQAELFQAGIVEFRSGHPQAYYAYMLKFRRLPPGDRTMKQLQDDMKNKAGSDYDLLLPDLPVPDIQPAITGAASDIEIAWEDPPPLPMPESDDPDADAISDGPIPPSTGGYSPSDGGAGSVEADADGDHISRDSDAGSIAAAAEDMPSVAVPCSDEWPSEIGGFTLKRISGRQGGANNFNSRLGVHCPCCIMKSRSTILLKDKLGEMAPVIYLAVWLQSMGEPNHRYHKPSIEDMLAYKSLHFP